MAGQSIRGGSFGRDFGAILDFETGWSTDPKSGTITTRKPSENVTVVYHHNIRIVDERETSSARTIPINSLGSETLALTKPLFVEISLEDDEYIVRMEDLDLYGAGKTESLALNMLKDEIVTLYSQLKSEKHLGPLPRRWKAALDDIVHEK